MHGTRHACVGSTAPNAIHTIHMLTARATWRQGTEPLIHRPARLSRKSVCMRCVFELTLCV